ncbi:F-box/LRR-repeat protein 14 [Brachypodium distachyon]|uniref:F-box domain-containing protein n=1 Tax=Brachypodium distachyon TaxID=15368 RepID=I1II07_BRADI|nr:F-box/LRR-repeat protein 14 [Brachypodium distachyon]XP_014758202.1 F-box/LRR-repeat protein 14 [Brachypodium distachyon]XP_024310776.1 F-box/LRR-repeat protein 14 [Brachypodium distachyon]KQJ86545.1 hypothetical protein BRADI_4g06200v3 [Brachypodium distachyon]PNT62635.1 hypothetical protein BRADI_4g06200v3 [Brachypodium distachyon]|eukprot:XP_014758201.1 F-box/LRR-repeat protein 14 [Brachypodium distachyon]
MEDLPEPLLAEIVKRIPRTSDLNSFSLVSKQLYTIEAAERGAIRVGCGLYPAREVLASLCSRFPNLFKVEINHSGWTPDHGNQLDNQGLFEVSHRCPLLTDLTLSFCSHINDSDLGCLAYCKKLVSLRLHSVPNITSNGLLSVAAGCKTLSGLYLVNCEKIESVEWLEYLGLNGSLEQLVVKKCEGISNYDLLKFGPGWRKLQKFEFEAKGGFWSSPDAYEGFDPLHNAHNPSRYGFCCESLRDLRLACFETNTEAGLRFLLGKCKALEKLCLEYVHGLNDNDMIVVAESCRNLKSISLWLKPLRYDHVFRTAFTDDSLKALAANCPMLEAVELTFAGCAFEYPSEIGFTQNGLVELIQSCPVRFLMLNGANFFDDEGMMALSTAPFLETIDLVDCQAVTDNGIRFITCTPRLRNLALRHCDNVTDGGVAQFGHAQKLESLVIDCCCRVSSQAIQGTARSVHYSNCAGLGLLKRMYALEMNNWMQYFQY